MSRIVYKQSFRSRTPRLCRFWAGFGMNALVLLVIFLFAGMSFLYLKHFNVVSTKGYELNRLQREREALVSEYEIHEMKLSEVRSLTAIRHSEKVGKMVRPNPLQITYMQSDSTIASK